MCQPDFQARLCALLCLLAAAPAALGQSCPGTGSCLVAHPEPGCDDPQCCADTCALLPDCCAVGWDQQCAELALSECTLCGAPNTGSCVVAHTTPACDDATCCGLICASDPFCCDVRWDATCAFYAGIMCTLGGGGTCGDPGAGSCLEPHSEPACADEQCCNTVCALDPSCCQSSWDLLCAAQAEAYCLGGCQSDCPVGAAQEAEICGLSTNDPCNGGVAEPIGSAACGVFGLTPDGVDRDWYSATLPGTGQVMVTLSLAADQAAFAALLPAGSCDMADAIGFVDSTGCGPTSISICIPAQALQIAVSTGSFALPDAAGVDCVADVRYAVTISVQGSCDPPACGTGGNCFLQHAEPACDDAECCGAVCAIDPLCCEAEWDAICVKEAVALCGAGVPENDGCEGALPLAAGTTAFSTLGATPLGAPLPCAVGPEGPDIWYRIEGLEGGWTVSTCATTKLDTSMELYGGACGALTLLACADDDPLCTAANMSSTINFAADCEESYLLRLGSRFAGVGTGTLKLTASGGNPCAQCPGDFDASGGVDGGDLSTLLGQFGAAGNADLDGDGFVTGSDLAALLAAWGPCP